MKRALIIICGLVIVVCIATLLLLTQNTAHKPYKQVNSPSDVNINDKMVGENDSKGHLYREITKIKRSSEPVKSPTGPLSYVSAYGELPGVLNGTIPDGELTTDTRGNLILAESIKDRFDYFLSAVSVEGLETCINRIEENITKTLPDPAKDAAMDILYSYINYKKSISDFYKETPSMPLKEKSEIEKIKKIMDKRNAMRRKYFEPDAVDAFFSEREAYDRLSMARLEIFYDSSLSDSEKKQKLAAYSSEQTLDKKNDYDEE